MLAVFFAAIVLGAVEHYSSQNDLQKNSLQTYLDDELSKVANTVKNSHPKEIDYNALSKSPYDILIQDNDSTVFWNNFITPQEQRYKSTADYAIIYKDIKNKHNISVSLDLRKNGKFSDHIKEHLHLTFKPGDKTHHSASIVDFQKKIYEISTIKIKQFSILNQFSYLFYFLFIVFFLKFIYQKIFQENKIPVSLGIVIGVLTFAVDHFFISNVFHDTYLASIKNSICGICPNLQTFIIGIVIITYFLTILKTSNFLNRINGKIKNILFPFLISSAFIYICYMAKGLLYSGPLSDLHTEILQYTGQGVIYLVSFILSLAIVFYGSVIFFKQNSNEQSQWPKYLSYIAGIVLTYPLAYFLDVQIPVWTLYTFVLSYILILELYIENTEKNIIYTIWWIIIFSGFLSSITFYYRLNDNVKVQSEIISNLYTFPTQSSNAKINSIDSILKESDIFFQLASLPYPSGLDKDDFESFVKTIITTTGLDIQPYDISLEVIDQQGITLFNNHFSKAYTFVQGVTKADRQSEHIFFNPFENTYYLQYKIENIEYNDAPLILSIKIDLNKDQKYIAPETNYIIFRNKRIIASNLVDNTQFNIGHLNSLDTTKIENDITYSVYKPVNGVQIVAFDKIGGLIKPISLFSFIVSISGILLFLISLINTKFRFLPSELNIQFYRSSSLRTKIQLAIIMLIVFSFLLIGIMTAFYFNSVLENYNNNNQKEDVTSIRNDIRNSIEGVENNLLASSTVQAKIDEMAHVHDKNLAFFDSQGKVLESSFTDPQIARVPFDIVRRFAIPGSSAPNNRIQLEQNKYTIEFLPVYYKSQKNPYGYLGISYKPINNASRSIRDFLSTILNVYVFLFLIAGALAIAIGNSITKPLAILSKKLKDFKLGKTNKVLDWDTKDEIGILINEYNTLTEKLDESVSILARTERDIAWREMAKQVAHEIKNPLTPMKLSIQYLEKAVKSNPEAATGMIERVSATLIEQINNLNQIANEFSNFATMPKASNEKIIINEIVEAIHDLFRKREDMDIQMTEPIDDLFVFADRNHLVRILNNIVKNAIQAIPTNKKGIIKMSLAKVGDIAIVSVKDNGSGIPDDMKDKVFTPNFTTKSSGTGLGLAISANMIESFNGRIYFETELGVGTEFFVEIPLMRLTDNYPEQQNRVSLD
ncbi:MAG: signal transduction histidine kinase [Saprospiraceae bacterium]|jgi:signal transduction histidine kinase